MRHRIEPTDYSVVECGYHTACWVAKTRKSNGRYPLMRLAGREIYMHRAMFEQEVGTIPAGMQIDHLCRFTYCIRPEHLDLVTPVQNVRRSRATKLTVAQAKRARYEGENARVLAAELGVSEFLIYQIRQGKIWKGV